MRCRDRFAAMLSVLFFAMCATAAAQKPVRVIDITYLRPDSLDDLWRDADMVAHVRVVETTARSRPAAPGISTPLVFSEATIEIVHKYRDTRDDGAEPSVVAQRAGRFELPDEIIEIADIEPLAPAREYILFLKWHPRLDMYEVTAGPEAIFELRDGRIRPHGKSAVARERANRSVDELIGDLRLRSRFERD